MEREREREYIRVMTANSEIVVSGGTAGVRQQAGAHGGMYVVKRDGRQEPVAFDKITARIQKLAHGLNEEFCDPIRVAQHVCSGVYSGVSTSELDELASQTAASLTSTHPDYAQLAARIAVSNMQGQHKPAISLSENQSTGRGHRP